MTAPICWSTIWLTTAPAAAAGEIPNSPDNRSRQGTLPVESSMPTSAVNAINNTTFGLSIIISAPEMLLALATVNH